MCPKAPICSSGVVCTGDVGVRDRRGVGERRQDRAIARSQNGAELGAHAHPERVPWRSASHGEDVAMEEFVLDRLLALDQSTLDGFAAAELRGRSAKTVNNRLAILSTLIKYVTGDKPRLRFKIAGMTGELASVPWPDVERLLAVADVRERAIVLLAAEGGRAPRR
jgi:integrase